MVASIQVCFVSAGFFFGDPLKNGNCYIAIMVITLWWLLLIFKNWWKAFQWITRMYCNKFMMNQSQDIAGSFTISRLGNTWQFWGVRIMCFGEGMDFDGIYSSKTAIFYRWSLLSAVRILGDLQSPPGGNPQLQARGIFLIFFAVFISQWWPWHTLLSSQAW